MADDFLNRRAEGRNANHARPEISLLSLGVDEQIPQPSALYSTFHISQPIPDIIRSPEIESVILRRSLE
jgi:hypothetical protein